MWRSGAVAVLALLSPCGALAQTSLLTTYNVTTLTTGIGSPTGIAVDSANNLFVAVANLDEIAVFNAAGGATGQFLGSGTGLISPWGVALVGTGTGSAATLAVADANGNAVYQLAAGTSTLLAGQSTAGSANGTGAAASFSSPLGVAVDSSGDIFVADEGNDVIREVTPAGVVTTVAGQVGVAATLDGTGTGAQLNRPTRITIDASGVLYVTTIDSIRRVTAAGVVTTVAGAAGVFGSQDGSGAAASFFYPQGIAVDQSDNLYVADTGNRTVRMVTAAGVVTTIAGKAGGNFTSTDGLGTAASFTNPVGVAVTPNGNLIYVTDQGAAAQGGGMIRLIYLPVAPQITANPAGVTVNAGSSFTLNVVALGGPVPMYQWYLYGSAISGATGASYTVTSAQAKDGGVYTVTATNRYGAVTSSGATVAVLAPPAITASPQGSQITASGTANLSVTASGDRPAQLSMASEWCGHSRRHRLDLLRHRGGRLLCDCHQRD